MLKFKFLLWMLARRRAIRNDPKAAAYVAGKNLTFQIRTKGGIGRHYRISKGTITSTAGGTRDAAFTMTFSSPAAGFRIRSAKDSQDRLPAGAARPGARSQRGFRRGDVVLGADRFPQARTIGPERSSSGAGPPGR
jgi:hypothetical protein